MLECGNPEVPIYEINPGEVFSISALVEPHILTYTGQSHRVSRVIRLVVEDINAAFAQDPKLECMMDRCVAKAAMGRLNSTRVQLAPAYS